MSYQKELFEAVSTGNLDRIEAITERPDAKSNINKIFEKSGETLLTEAARQGQYATLEYMIEKHGADPNTQNAAGQSPMHFAAASGDIRCVKLLYSNDGKIDVLDGDGKSPLHWAIRSNHDKVVTYLLENGADVNIQTIDGNSCLQEAILHAKQDIVSKLLKINLNIQHRNKRGESLLYSAARAGRDKVVEKLLSLGADINVTTSNGETILYECARLGKIKVVEFILNFLKRYCDPEDGYVINEGFIDKQTTAGECEVFGVMVETVGWTALHVAVGQGHYEIVKLLLENGAKTKIINADNLTPEDLCLAYKRKDIMPLFRPVKKKSEIEAMEHTASQQRKKGTSDRDEWKI